MKSNSQPPESREDTIAYLLDRADEFDDGELYWFESDERDIAIFDQLVYSEERRMWLARFLPAHPEATCDPTPDEATYSENCDRCQLLAALDIKPSQGIKAMSAFHRKFDEMAEEILKDLDFPLDGPALQ